MSSLVDRIQAFLNKVPRDRISTENTDNSDIVLEVYPAMEFISNGASSTLPLGTYRDTPVPGSQDYSMEKLSRQINGTTKNDTVSKIYDSRKKDSKSTRDLLQHKTLVKNKLEWSR